MKFFGIVTFLPVLLTLSSAWRVDRNIPAVREATHGSLANSFLAGATSACDKEDDADCTEFCKLNGQTSSCVAAGNKITCRCEGGKGGESNCEERCLLCMPGKSALDEATHLFRQGGTKQENLEL